RNYGPPSRSPTNRLCRGHLLCRASPANRRPCCMLQRSRCYHRKDQALHTRLVFELTPLLFLPLLPLSWFPPLFYVDNLFADKLVKAIEHTVPALIVAIARFFAGQLLVA